MQLGLKIYFLVDPKEYRYVAVKRIFRYLKGTPDYGLWYIDQVISPYVLILMRIGKAIWMKKRVVVVENLSLEEYWFLDEQETKFYFIEYN